MFTRLFVVPRDNGPFLDFFLIRLKGSIHPTPYNQGDLKIRCSFEESSDDVGASYI